MVSKITYLSKSLLEMADKASKRYKRSKTWILGDMIISACLYSVSPANYYYFGFPDLNSDQRKTYTTHSVSEKIQEKYNNKKYHIVFYDKLLFSKIFAEFFGRNRESVGTKGLEFNRFAEFVKKHTKFIFKPLNGGQGKGIEVFEDIQSSKVKELFDYISDLGEGVLESWINQHEEMSELYAKAVNPIRIQTLYDGKDCHFLGSTLTIGYKKEIANASASALFALIDVENGKVTTDACDYDGNTYTSHPETNMVFKDFQVPHWDLVLEMLRKAAACVPQIGYVGWDVAITEEGPILIEGNNDPGYVGYQLAELCGKHGTKALYERFI